MSGVEVSARVKRMGSILHPDMKGNLIGTRIRKSVVSTHRNSEAPRVSSELLAKQMTHSKETADSHYNVSTRDPDQVMVAEFLKTMQRRQPSTQPSTSKLSAISTDPATTSRLHVASKSSPDGERTTPHLPDLTVLANVHHSSSSTQSQTTPLTVQQRKHLLRLFSGMLDLGECPDLAIITSTVARFPSVSSVDPSIILNYLKPRVMPAGGSMVRGTTTSPTTSTATTTATTMEDITRAWAASHKEEQLSYTCPTYQKRERLFVGQRGVAFQRATSNLNSSARLVDILGALQCQEGCHNLGIFPKKDGGLFTRQQLRNKFRSLRKGLDKEKRR